MASVAEALNELGITEWVLRGEPTSEDEMKSLLPATMVSQAYIFAKDKKHVWTFSSYDTESAVFSDRNCFPRSIIKKMERITL